MVKEREIEAKALHLDESDESPVREQEPDLPPR